MKPFNEIGIQIVKFNCLGDEALHGDVIITSSELPIDFESMPIVENSCLALGEATGHMHKLVSGDFELREDPKTKVKHLRLVTEAFLKHQEHSPLLLPPGNYRIGIQQEYDPFERLIRQVAD